MSANKNTKQNPKSGKQSRRRTIDASLEPDFLRRSRVSTKNVNLENKITEETSTADVVPDMEEKVGGSTNQKHKKKQSRKIPYSRRTIDVRLEPDKKRKSRASVKNLNVAKDTKDTTEDGGSAVDIQSFIEDDTEGQQPNQEGLPNNTDDTQKRDKNRRASLFSREQTESGTTDKPNIEEGKPPKKNINQINTEFQNEKVVKRPTDDTQQTKMSRRKILTFIGVFILLLLLSVVIAIYAVKAIKKKKKRIDN